MDNPLLDFSGLPRFDAIRAEHVTPAIDSLLAEAEAAGQIAPQPALLRLTFLMGAVMGPVLVAAMLKDGGVLPALVRRQVMPQVLSDAAIAQRIDLALRALVQGVPDD